MVCSSRSSNCSYKAADMPGHASAAVPLAAVKRKNNDDGDRMDDDDDASDSGSDVSMIDVDFDFYNFNPDVDQIALKRLLRQTLATDAELIDVHALADYILEQNTAWGVGSTIKTEGTEADPYAVLGVVSLDDKSNPALTPLVNYFTSQSALQIPSNTGLIISERLINLPLQLVPPMYKMLLDELKTARMERGEGVPQFDNYLIWGRGYKLAGVGGETMKELEADSVRTKKSKKAKTAANAAVTEHEKGSFLYHPEEEFFESKATASYTYSFKTSAPRDSESFGVEQFGRLMLVPASRMDEVVQQMIEACR